MAEREYTATLVCRFVDDDDVLTTGRAWLEVDGHEGLTIPIPEGYSGFLEDIRRSEGVSLGAQSAAEKAQALAESAKAGAVVAQTAAEAAQTGAVAAETAAESAKTGAVAAQTAAVAAQTAAETARTGAEAAKAGAEKAQTAAETARTGAEAASDRAKTARTGAEIAETKAETAQTAAESAKTAAEVAKAGAETARTGAETAKTAAETARTGAETARDEAVAAKTSVANKAEAHHTHVVADITDLPPISNTSIVANGLVQRDNVGRIKGSDYWGGDYVVNAKTVDEKLALKANKTHTHTMKDITDLPTVSQATLSNTLVQRSGTQITVPTTPNSASDAVSKDYVDRQVSTRALTAHKHTLGDITDYYRSSYDYKSIHWLREGHIVVMHCGGTGNDIVTRAILEAALKAAPYQFAPKYTAFCTLVDGTEPFLFYIYDGKDKIEYMIDGGSLDDFAFTLTYIGADI